MSITTHTSTIRQWVKNHTKDDIAIYFEDQFVKKEAAIDAAKNLLAVIHRDGGHHTDKVGFVQSCKDAEQVRHELMQAIDAKDTEIERLYAIFIKTCALMDKDRVEIESLRARNAFLEGVAKDMAYELDSAVLFHHPEWVGDRLDFYQFKGDVAAWLKEVSE